MPIYLMSYPAPGWRIRGGENFRSRERAATSPRAALREWLGLCEAITDAGGEVLVMPPAEVDPPLTGMVYTANSGALFDGKRFLVSKMFVAHRQDEQSHVKRFMKEAGLEVELAAAIWEGQADITSLPEQRFILTWGVRSTRESVAEVRSRLPSSGHVLEVKIRDPFFHGDTCLDLMQTRDGKSALLVHDPALVDCSLDELALFASSEVAVLPVIEADALRYACNALCVNGRILAPRGLSNELKRDLEHHGFELEELELGELFGKGGGGPRCLVNELRGFKLPDGAPTYARERARLSALVDKYPSITER